MEESKEGKSGPAQIQYISWCTTGLLIVPHFLYFYLYFFFKDRLYFVIWLHVSEYMQTVYAFLIERLQGHMCWTLCVCVCVC